MLYYYEYALRIDLQISFENYCALSLTRALSLCPLFKILVAHSHVKLLGFKTRWGST